MSAHRKDVEAEAMYAVYQTGKSLAEVAREFGLSRQTVFTAFQRRGYQLRKRPDPLPYVVFNGRKYTMRNTGYYGATEGDRGLLHRHMWEATNGPIPDGYDIHHLDESKTNNTLSNFECLPKAEHTRLYSPHCNQFHHNCEHRNAA